MIKSIPKFDALRFVEWTRSYNGVLQIPWPFLSKIISGLERREPIPRGSRKGEKNSSDFDDKDSNPSNVRGHNSGSLNEEPHNGDDIKA